MTGPDTATNGSPSPAGTLDASSGTNALIPMGIGRPNLEYTTDYGDPSGATKYFTIHMRIDPDPQDMKALDNAMMNATTNRAALKGILTAIVARKYKTSKGARTLIGGILDDPNVEP